MSKTFLRRATRRSSTRRTRSSSAPSLSAGTVAKADRLKIVSRHGVGYDAVDVAALNARGIPLCVVGDVNSISVAEHAMMLILAATKRVIRADRSIRQANWGWRNNLEAGDVA